MLFIYRASRLLQKKNQTKKKPVLHEHDYEYRFNFVAV